MRSRAAAAARRAAAAGRPARRGMVPSIGDGLLGLSRAAQSAGDAVAGIAGAGADAARAAAGDAVRAAALQAQGSGPLATPARAITRTRVVVCEPAVAHSVIADVEDYVEWMPWCVAAERVPAQAGDEDGFTARIIFGFDKALKDFPITKEEMVLRVNVSAGAAAAADAGAAEGAAAAPPALGVSAELQEPTLNLAACSFLWSFEPVQVPSSSGRTEDGCRVNGEVKIKMLTLAHDALFSQFETVLADRVQSAAIARIATVRDRARDAAPAADAAPADAAPAADAGPAAA